MMKQRGIQQTTYKKRYFFTKEELEILKPLQQMKTDMFTKYRLIDQDIKKFVVERVGGKYTDPNKKYAFDFNVLEGWLDIREKVDGVSVTPMNYKDVLK